MVKNSFLNKNQSDPLKAKLIEALQTENAQLSSVIKAYSEKSTLQLSEKETILQAIIDTAQHVLDAGDWESSLFLRTQAKTIKRVLSDAENGLRELRERQSTEQGALINQLASDEREVYISLFQNNGYNLDAWAMQLRSLSRYVVGRPVYISIEDIEKRIRLRGDLPTEAYVVLGVKRHLIRTDFLGNQMKDQFNIPLIQLPDQTVAQSHILRFVHLKRTYVFVDGALVGQ